MKEKIKTTWKKIWKPVTIAAGVLVIAAVSVPIIASSMFIGVDNAKDIAKDYSGVTGDVKYTEAKLDWDDRLYDIEFVSDGVKYEMEVDADSGQVLNFDRDGQHISTGDNTNTSNTNNSSGNSNSGGAVGSGTITEDEAKNIALNHAGVAASDATFLRSSLDRDDGRLVYDVEFYVGNKEYDYEIDAASGDILSYDYDTEWNIPASGNNSGNGSNPSGSSSSNGGTITEDEAKSIALNHADVAASDATFFRSSLDRDDGRLVYDVEFYVGNKEYDYEIDAASGDILSYDYDTEWDIPASSNSSGSTSSSASITADEAKNIALQHAGIAEGDTYGLHTETDWDHGRTEYEVEFKSGGYEYSYTIDAADGSIIEYDRDRD